jgi:DNA-binding GntR family transcriptional regulator
MPQPQKSDLAYAAIKQAIIEKALTPGTKLPEDTLGGHLGMSRTLIRAALARLTAEGLVDSQPNRGATVAQPTLEEARNVFELRRALEAEVVRLVVERWKPACGHALDAHVKQEELAARQGQPAASARLAGEFHIVLAELAGNALLARYTSEVVSRCSLILAVHGRPHSSECAVAAHLGSVQSRALPGEVAAEEADLGDILGRYLPAARPAVSKPRAAGPARKRATR